MDEKVVAVLHDDRLDRFDVGFLVGRRWDGELALAGAAAMKAGDAGGKRDGPLMDVLDDPSTLIRLVRA